jgi:uncharacterized protein (TIGR03086 family)
MADSPESIADRYRRRADTLGATVAAVPADKWDAQSPCPDWKARDVLQHLIDSQGIFLGMVGAELEPGPSVDEDPSAAWDAARAQTQARLDDPAQAAQEFDGMTGKRSYEDGADTFLSLDLIVHRWDLARATGTDDTIPPEDLSALVEAMDSMSAEMGEAMRSPRAFGPALTPPEGADTQTKVLAFAGRQAW